MNCRAERGGLSDSFRRSVMYWLMVSGALLGIMALAVYPIQAVLELEGGMSKSDERSTL